MAVCLLHAYANTAHEVAALEEIRRLWPEVSVVASHQITREWREYERTNTAVLSAYVQPVAARYLGKLDAGLKSQGLKKSPCIMQSNRGVDSLQATSAVPINMVESGPASGFWGAAELGKLIGEENILALDIGGTTAKCSLIEGGEVRIMTDYWIERSGTSAGYPIMVPVVDLVEIGNGGGSIAWVDEGGLLHIGPQSAGAVPGPVCYGKGGVEPTVTDASVVLGWIDPGQFNITDCFDKCGVTHLFTKSTKRSCNLRIKQGRWNHTNFMVDHFEILPCRMNNFQRSITTQESGDRCEIKAREWVDTDGLMRRRNLNQAKPGMVRSNSLELGINTNPGRTRHVLTEQV